MIEGEWLCICHYHQGGYAIEGYNSVKKINFIENEILLNTKYVLFSLFFWSVSNNNTSFF